MPRGVDARSLIWLLLMCLALFIVLLPFSSYVAALPFIQDEWGLNNTEAGAVFSAFLAGYAVSTLFVLPLTDRVGPRYIFLASAAISAASHALFPVLADGMPSAIALRAIAGVGLVGVYMPGLRLISERFPSEGRGMAMGLYVSAFYGANAASLAATGGLMAALDWRDAYLAMSLASAAGIPLVYLLLRSHRHTPDRRSSGRLDLAVLKNRPARYFILGYSLHAAELYAVRVWLPVFLAAVLVARGTDRADAAITAATVGGIALAAGSIGPVMGGIISDRWGRVASASAIFALSGACSWLIGWIGDFPWGIIIFVAVVYGWAISADSSIYSTAVTEVAAPEALGSTMAVQAFIGFMGGVVGPILVGGILDLSPDSIKWGIGFSAIGFMSVIGIAGLLRLRSPPAVQVIPKGPR